MPSAFSYTGSTAGNPTVGLLGNSSSKLPTFGANVPNLGTGSLNIPTQKTTSGVSQVPVTSSNPYGLSVAPKTTSGLLPANGTASNPGLLPKPPAPSTPLKSTTTKNIDGSEITQTYHAPAVQANTTQPTPTTPTPSPYTPNNNSQAGFIGKVSQAGGSTPEENYWKDQYQKSVAGTQFGKLAPYAEAGMNVGKTPEELQGLITAPDLVGRSAGDNGLYNALGSAYGNAALAGLSASQTDAARNLSANTSAASLTAPSSQFGILTNPQTGEIIGGSGSNAQQLMGTSLQKALSYIQSGSSFEDAINTSGLGQFGDFGKSLLSSAISNGGNSSFSPTSYGTQVATNQSQGSDYQKQATQLDTTLKQLDTLEPIVSNFLQSSGLNSQENPFYNKSINTYISQLKNPADVTSLNAMLGDVKTYTAQILGSSGLNPTEVSQTVNSFDPSQLNGAQLTAFLANLKNLGQARLKPLQDTSASSYGSSTGYSGTAANPSSTPTLGPENAPSALNNNNPVIQGLIGGGMNTLGTIENAISGLANSLFH